MLVRGSDEQRRLILDLIGYKANKITIENKDQADFERAKEEQEKSWKRMTLHDAIEYLFKNECEDLSEVTKLSWYSAFSGTSSKSKKIRPFDPERGKTHAFGSYLKMICGQERLITDITPTDIRGYIRELQAILDITPSAKASYVLVVRDIFKNIKEFIFKSDFENPFSDVNFDSRKFKWVIKDGKKVPHPDLRKMVDIRYFATYDYYAFLIQAFQDYLEKKQSLLRNPRDAVVRGIHIKSLERLLTITLFFNTICRLNELRTLEWSGVDSPVGVGIYSKQELIQEHPANFTEEDLRDYDESERFIIVRRKPTENYKDIQYRAAWLSPITLAMLDEKKRYHFCIKEEIVNPRQLSHIKKLKKFPRYVFSSDRNPENKCLSKKGMHLRFWRLDQKYSHLKAIRSHTIRYLVKTKGGKEFGLTQEEAESCLSHKLVRIASSRANGDVEIFKMPSSARYYDKGELLRQIMSTKKWFIRFCNKKSDYETLLGKLNAYFLNKENLRVTDNPAENYLIGLRKAIKKKNRVDYFIRFLADLAARTKVNIGELEQNAIDFCQEVNPEYLETFKKHSYKYLNELMNKWAIIQRQSYVIEKNGKRRTVSPNDRNAIKEYLLQPKWKWKYPLEKLKYLNDSKFWINEPESNEDQKRLEAYERYLSNVTIPKLQSLMKID